MSFTKGTCPEPNRLIKCWGSDWSDFIVFGKFVPYSPKARDGKGRPMDPKRIARGRFMERDKYGEFWPARERWLDVERWEYADEPKTLPTSTTTTTVQERTSS